MVQNPLSALALAMALAGAPAAQAGTLPALAGKPPAGSPVALHGALHVCHRQLCDRLNRPLQLRGMSTHGLQWYSHCLTPASLDALARDWHASVMRVSMYVQEDGYASDPPGFSALAERLIDALIARGLYVIVDWHLLDPGDPMVNLARARVYFDRIARRYAGVPNLLYEIANEPNGSYAEGAQRHRVDWARIRAYAQRLLPVIRAQVPAAVVIVGTPDWSSLGVSGGSGPAEVWERPLADPQLMYGFHFYAASHGQTYRQALEQAAARLPIFVTEWGSQEYTGDGPDDFVSAGAYLELMQRLGISWASWNYSDDPRSGAAFVPGTCERGGPWNGAALKPAGAWVRARIAAP